MVVGVAIGVLIILAGMILCTDRIDQHWKNRQTMTLPQKHNRDAILKDAVTGQMYTISESGIRVYVHWDLEDVIHAVNYVEACRYKDLHGGSLQMGTPDNLWRWATNG